MNENHNYYIQLHDQIINYHPLLQKNMSFSTLTHSLFVYLSLLYDDIKYFEIFILFICCCCYFCAIMKIKLYLTVFLCLFVQLTIYYYDLLDFELFYGVN